MTLGSGARIGHLNLMRSLENIEMGDGAIISNLNWISAHPKADDKFFQKYKARQPSLILGRESAITSKHIIDCTDKVTLGKYSTIAGYNSQLFTHSIDLVESEQSCAAITIGEYCFIGTRCTILPGVEIANKVVTGAGSVLIRNLEKGKGLYAGQPAVFVKSLEKLGYFSRTKGEVV